MLSSVIILLFVKISNSSIKAFNDLKYCFSLITPPNQTLPLKHLVIFCYYESHHSTVLINIKSAAALVIAGVGEVNTANTNGLRIIVTVNAPSFVGYTRTQVNGEKGALLNYGSTMSGGTTTVQFLFYPNQIDVGEKFNVCVTVVSTKQIECTSGINRSASEPEYVSINMPITGNTPNTGNTQGINWGAIYRSFDSLIVEPCNTLTTPDGYTLTSEGQRVFLV